MLNDQLLRQIMITTIATMDTTTTAMIIPMARCFLELDILAVVRFKKYLFLHSNIF